MKPSRAPLKIWKAPVGADLAGWRGRAKACVCLCLMGSLFSASGAPKLAPLPSRPPEALPQAPLREVGPGVFQLGDVRLNRAKQTVSFPGAVNMTNRQIEYAIVSGIGKLHESLLRADAEPYHIHLAMLLIGAKTPAAGATANGLAGPSVKVRLSWLSPTGEVTAPIEQWILNTSTGQPLAPGGWVYNGSRVGEGTYLAQWEGSIAAIIEDPDAMLNNRTKDRENDEIWTPRPGVVPPVGTPVQIEIQIADKKSKEGNEKNHGQK